MVEIPFLNGPFRQLKGFWQFEVLEEGGDCRVWLNLEFKFSSCWLALKFGLLFNQIATILVDAFCKRADIIYRKNL